MTTTSAPTSDPVLEKSVEFFKAKKEKGLSWWQTKVVIWFCKIMTASPHWRAALLTANQEALKANGWIEAGGGAWKILVRSTPRGEDWVQTWEADAVRRMLEGKLR